MPDHSQILNHVSPGAAIPSPLHPVYLSDVSPDDKPWDVHRAQVDGVQRVYQQAADFERYAVRLGECAGALGFRWLTDTETGEACLKLHGATFCRVRYCPVCQWRRSLMWQARFYQALPLLQERFPRHRWLFLTLTVKNCHVAELRTTLQSMNKSWGRLVKRVEFQLVEGWARTTEITRSADGTAHPHFHVLLMVKPSYFTGGGYVTQSAWVEAWRGAARLDYQPLVDVRAVKPKRRGVEDGGISGAVQETLKYSVKPGDMLADNGDWFLELTRQTHRLRFIATGGALKGVLKPETEIKNEDLIHPEGEQEADDEPKGHAVFFDWDRTPSRYKKRS